MNGLVLSRFEIGEGRSLAVGFGRVTDRRVAGRVLRQYAEYEMGSYYRNWFIDSGGGTGISPRNMQGSTDEIPSITKGKAFEGIEIDKMGRLVVNLTQGVRFTFSQMSLKDEAFHVFIPGGGYVEWSRGGKWKEGPADEPW